MKKSWKTALIVVVGILVIVKFRGEIASAVSKIPGVGDWLVS